MRRSVHQYTKALQFSLWAVCGVMAVSFYLDDGPIRLPHMLASAQADELKVDAAALEPKPSLPPAFALHFPAGYEARWGQQSLDGGRILLQGLQTPFNLSQTTCQSGTEAFQYAASLFDQLSVQVQDAQLATDLKALSLQSQAMGESVQQASALRFDGAPSTDMAHLKVRSDILSYLAALNPHALVTVHYDAQGRLLDRGQPAPSAASGKAVQALMNRTHALLSRSGASLYPQAMALVSRESALLQKLASHLTVRWESTELANRANRGIATYMRVYTRQTLPGDTLAAIPF